MTRGATRAAVLAGCLALAAACGEERERPAPPFLGITIDQDSVSSPDTLTGTIVASDADGIDSIWLAVDSGTPIGADAFFQKSFFAPYSILVPGGRLFGERVDVLVTARDIRGWVGTLDTFVVVKHP